VGLLVVAEPRLRKREQLGGGIQIGRHAAEVDLFEHPAAEGQAEPRGDHRALRVVVGKPVPQLGQAVDHAVKVGRARVPAPAHGVCIAEQVQDAIPLRVVISQPRGALAQRLDRCIEVGGIAAGHDPVLLGQPQEEPCPGQKGMIVGQSGCQAAGVTDRLVEVGGACCLGHELVTLHQRGS
jgi:hypothetical protein